MDFGTWKWKTKDDERQISNPKKSIVDHHFFLIRMAMGNVFDTF
jgi:hypothetical protein